MPYWPIYAAPDADTVFDFLTQEQLRYGLIAATEDGPCAPARGHCRLQRGNLVRWNRATRARRQLCHGRLEGSRSLLAREIRWTGGGRGSNDYAQYTTYQLPTGAEYEVARIVPRHFLRQRGQANWTGLWPCCHRSREFGRSVGGRHPSIRPAGLVVLRWQALEPIDNDLLKVSLFLTDEAGHLAGQVDDRLFGDFYLFEDVWKMGHPQAVTTSCLRFQPSHRVATCSTLPFMTATRSSATRSSIPPRARSPLQLAWGRWRSPPACYARRRTPGKCVASQFPGCRALSLGI